MMNSATRQLTLQAGDGTSTRFWVAQRFQRCHKAPYRSGLSPEAFAQQTLYTFDFSRGRAKM
jgi:hypothetical protein